MLDEKYRKLTEMLKGYETALVAFSGGVDSTFLLAVCREVLKDRCAAATIRHIAHREQEIADAMAIASRLGVRHRVIDAVQSTRDIFHDNAGRRCFYCKMAVGTLLKATAREWGCSHVLDASQLDDLNENRPGMQAIKNLGIQTPLIDAALRKDEIRAYSQRLALPTYDKPASPCLATRFPVGQPVTESGLFMVAQAEDLLTNLGYRGVRVRLDNELDRIEVQPADIHTLYDASIRIPLIMKLKSFGFKKILVDMEGYQPSSHGAHDDMPATM